MWIAVIISIIITTTSIGTSEEDVERLVAAMDVDGDGKVTYQEYLSSFRLDFDYADKGQWCEISRAKGFYFYNFLQFLDGCLSPRVTFLINSRLCVADNTVTVTAELCI